MIKLYYAPNTRATRPRWMLEELSVPYELVKLDLQKGENRAPAYLAVHPLGQVPALEDGAVRVFESAAIVAWLADRYAAKGLAPALDAPERAAYLQWLFFGAVTLEPQIARYANATAGPEEKRDAARAAASKEAFAALATVLERHLAGRQFLLGDAFSAADVIVGSMVGWARALKLVADFPALHAYSKRLSERPAWARSRSG